MSPPHGPEPSPEPSFNPSSRRRAAIFGVRQATGVPAIVLGASFLGFGALVRQTDLTIWHGLLSTLTGWALPGQVALIELYAVGASLVAIAAAVALTNARLLPMTITLMPLIRGPKVPRWQYYLAAHLIAVTGWAAAMRDCPRLAVEERLPYFAGFASLLLTVSLAATALGYQLAGLVPATVSLGLVFINPIYFMLLFAADVRDAPRVLALLLGALAGPLLHLVTPDWGLLLTGLIAGSLAFSLRGLLKRG
ncbi:MAG: AzlC family ABC transporter permease [Kiloniellales bacterium]